MPSTNLKNTQAVKKPQPTCAASCGERACGKCEQSATTCNCVTGDMQYCQHLCRTGPAVHALCAVTWRLVWAGSAGVCHAIVCGMRHPLCEGLGDAAGRRAAKLSHARYQTYCWHVSPYIYATIGQYALGQWGRHLVMVFTTIELMGSNTMCLIIMQQQVEIFLPLDGAKVLCMHAQAQLARNWQALSVCQPSTQPWH